MQPATGLWQDHMSSSTARHRLQELQASCDEVIGPSLAVRNSSRLTTPSVFTFCVGTVPDANHCEKGVPITCGDNRRSVWDPQEAYPSLWEENLASDAPPLTSPIDFLFAGCGESGLPVVSHEEVPAPTIQVLRAAPSERTPIVSRTFHWAPGDFPLEMATYMQCEESFVQETATPKTWLPPRPGCGRRSTGKIATLRCGDDPLDADDLEAEFETAHRGTSSTMVQQLPSSSLLPEFENIARTAGTPSGIRDTDANLIDWQPDWSFLPPLAETQ